MFQIANLHAIGVDELDIALEQDRGYGFENAPLRVFAALREDGLPFLTRSRKGAKKGRVAEGSVLR